MPVAPRSKRSAKAETLVHMKILFLGTGTSVGVPAIGCDCAVCLSEDPHNKRLRTSVYLEAAGQHILIDTTPDFRTQAITHKVMRVDAVLLTHFHADHVLGFDDIRRFNTIQGCLIPTYGIPETIAEMKNVFGYVHKKHVSGVYRPRVTFNEISDVFQIGPVSVQPIRVDHGPHATCGYRIEAEGRTLGYFPDCHEMSDGIVELLKGIDVMVLDALRHRSHKTHLTVENSVSLLQRIGAGKSYLIHMCHDLDHDKTQATLPESVFMSYDGLSVEW